MENHLDVETRHGRMLRLERGLMRVRWFGVAFAVFQILMGTDPRCKTALEVPDACEPPWLRPIGYSLALLLGVANLGLWVWLRKPRSERAIAVAGLCMFLVDHLVLISIVWLYSGYLNSTTWVILYIAPLEGALRYRMRGAMASIAIMSAFETARDVFRKVVWGFPFQFVPGTTFRIGILAIIGLVAGIMARNLERERLEVVRRAELLEDLAEKEGAARAELQAFHEAIIAGLSTANFDKAMQSMIDTIGETLGLDSLALGLLEQGPDGETRLRVVAGHRYPPESIGKTLGLGEGVSGPVARTGTPALVEDVSQHSTYLNFAPWAQSEMVVALKTQDRIIGVLNAESPRKGAFNQSSLEQLERLATQVSVVVENARVLAREREAVERLTELDTMKTDFIAITSHELRTPLTVLRGFIQTMLRPEVGFDPVQIEKYLEVMDRQTGRLNSIVEDLLFVSRIESGELDLHTSIFNITDAVEDLVQERFSDDSNRIIVNVPASDIEMITDRERLNRIISGLIENALKFSPPSSSISLTIRDNGEKIQIEVEDEGIGIPQEELDRIFERFHQVGGSMRRHQHGFGLGLYMCSRIAAALSGEVRVSSVPGEGSTFTVTLPKTIAQTTEEPTTIL